MTIDCVSKTANISEINGKDFSPTGAYIQF